MAFGRMKYASRRGRSRGSSYGSFGVRDGYFIRYGDNVKLVPGDRPERTRRRRQPQPQMPRTPQGRQRLAGRPQQGIGSRVGQALQSPAGQAAIDLAARALAARFGIPLPNPGDMLALPPPRD